MNIDCRGRDTVYYFITTKSRNKQKPRFQIHKIRMLALCRQMCTIAMNVKPYFVRVLYSTMYCDEKKVTYEHTNTYIYKWKQHANDHLPIS